MPPRRFLLSGFLGAWLYGCTAERPGRDAGAAGGQGGGGGETIEVAASDAATGDAEAASTPQAVLWFGLGVGQGATCPSLTNYQLPEDARSTISGNSGLGGRIQDGGDHRVECEVRLASGSTSKYDVNLRFQGGEIGNFVVDGMLAQGVAGTFDVSFTTGQFSLSQSECTGDRKHPVGGIWAS